MKVHRSLHTPTDDGSWRHAEIRLEPDTDAPGSPPIVLTEMPEDAVRVVAELVGRIFHPTGVSATHCPFLRPTAILASLGPLCLAIVPAPGTFGESVADTPAPRQCLNPESAGFGPS